MAVGGTVNSAGVVGRDPELGVLRRFVEAAAPGRALVLTGDAGIGKTTLWEAGVGLARDCGLRVLVARPSGAEAGLSFAALIDLFAEVDAGALMDVPAPQRSALEIALLRAEPAATPPEPHAIALGFLSGLRALTADRPLLIAVDDVQWLDSPSADVLVFAARRLRDEPVAFLLCKRPGAPSVLELELRTGLEHLEVGPLGFGASQPHPQPPAPEEMVEVAYWLQDQFFHETWGAWGEPRPRCPGHAHPMTPAEIDSEAWSTCPLDDRAVVRIGAFRG